MVMSGPNLFEDFSSSSSLLLYSMFLFPSRVWPLIFKNTHPISPDITCLGIDARPRITDLMMLLPTSPLLTPDTWLLYVVPACVFLTSCHLSANAYAVHRWAHGCIPCRTTSQPCETQPVQQPRLYAPHRIDDRREGIIITTRGASY